MSLIIKKIKALPLAILKHEPDLSFHLDFMSVWEPRRQSVTSSPT